MKTKVTLLCFTFLFLAAVKKTLMIITTRPVLIATSYILLTPPTQHGFYFLNNNL